MRSFRAGDEYSLATNANHREIWRNLKDTFPHPYTIDNARWWVAENKGQTPPQHLAIVVDDMVVGGIGIELKPDIWRFSAELGYWLGPEYWGRGLMTSVLRVVVEYAFDTFDINRLWAGAFVWNAGSMRVLEKAGFVYEARLQKSAFKDGEFVDEVIYAIVRPYRGTSTSSQ
ncbi:MAG: GNAT family protein [Gemmatimonadota bacterium]